jgi:dynein heavy chain, axonemal
MSQQLDDLGKAMFDGFLPAQWAKIAPQTQKPLGSWMEHYTRRHEQ